MASAFHLPGAYPGSAPATPSDETTATPQPQQPVEAPHQHNHYDRNKLHNREDPRGHAVTDSGVGLTDSEPIYTTQNEYHWKAPSEAVGGGTYSREQSAAFEAPRQRDLPRNPDLASRGAEHDVHTRVPKADTTRAKLPPRESEEEFPQRQSEGGSRLSGIDYNGSDKSMTEHVPTRTGGQTDGGFPPYWGALPKAAGGGIYNTVVGHGSANDDHDQHHGLHQRGGIHNSVAGHGSNDTESQRHSFSQSGQNFTPVAGNAGPSSSSPAASGGLLAAPLPKIAEGEQKKSFAPSAADYKTPGHGEALLAAPAARSAEPQVSSKTSIAQPKPEQPHQRAFPLAPSHAGREDERKRSSSQTRNPALAAAAGLGAGAAAYGLADKHEKDKLQAEPTRAAQQTRHSRSTSEDHGRQPPVGIFARRSREERRSSSADKHNKNLHSEEKRHSKIFGRFHRNKDEDPNEHTPAHEPAGKSVDYPMENMAGIAPASPKTRNVLRKGSRNEGARGSREPSTDREHSRHRKEKVAAAAGVGALGLHHHKKEENLKDASRRSSMSETGKPVADAAHPPLGARGANNNGNAAAAPVRHAQVAAAGAGAGLLAGVGGYGMAKRNDVPEHETIQEVSTPFEHPREPPLPPHAGESEFGHASGPTSTTMAHHAHNEPRAAFTALPTAASAGLKPAHAPASDASSRGVVTQQPGEYNQLPSGTASGVKQEATHSSGSGASKGLMAAGALGAASAMKHDNYRPSESTTSQKGVSGDYRHLPSGTASGVKVEGAGHSPEHNVASHGRGTDGYNHLHSGTASGVKPPTSSATNTAAAAARPANERTDSGPYNKLPSGTPSGVKIKSKEQRTRRTSEPAVNAQTYSSNMPPRQSLDASSARKDLPLPPSSSSPTDANSPIHHTILRAPETGRAAYPETQDRSTMHATAYPNAAQAKNMSPEVMPESYRESVMPPHTSQPQEKNMSPEVMPESYRHSVIPPHTSRSHGAERDVSPRGTTTNDVVSSAPAWQQSKPSAPEPSIPVPSSNQAQNNTLPQSKDRSAAIDPALAAATASWGVQGSTIGHVPITDKVTHKCEHCGNDTDITSYVRRAQESLLGGNGKIGGGNSGLWKSSK
ncbi:hypothetical protein QBC42DRAFT_173297 [Cladorrhinum samala]|uniref:Uncharacterized protein n=1 Tax=Cladorrhinum samala TaxID=585594 RepID=A0AAV9HRQ5_9PEZI|nr:hypothetical protein QBC42DRAFT_173297 [Cladorrhinum samala]